MGLRHGCDLRVMGPTSCQTAPPRVVGKGPQTDLLRTINVGARRTALRAQYANKHYHESGHPVVASFEPDEDRRRCYADEALV